MASTTSTTTTAAATTTTMKQSANGSRRRDNHHHHQEPPAAASGDFNLREWTLRSQLSRENTKSWQCLYPIYFDARRSRAEGRRVSSEHAVENPLAREIADAVWGLKLQVAIEPDKTHPKDWANPGRVRVLVKENGKLMNRNVKNSTFAKT